METKLRILINAYACSPGMGSEPGMAWNWCLHLAKHAELFIVTEGEFREKIEAALPTLPQGARMHFYYNPVTEDIRRMCWNQGDWRFYKYYKEWQRKTYLMAKDICQRQQIDVLHQLNMIGFREPGYLWKLSRETGVPFVWGPIGGLKQFPLRYAAGGGWKMGLKMAVKNCINILQLRYDRRVDAALRQASLLVSSIPDSYRAIKRHKRLESIVIPETGCFPLDIKTTRNDRFHGSTLRIVWVGKFDFRKRIDLALRAVAAAVNPNVALSVYGTGTERQVTDAKMLAEQLGIGNQVEWMGNRPNAEVRQAMGDADLFLFTSVSEDTSTVVLEAISAGLPVVCFDCCGMSAVIDGSVGAKVPLTTPTQSVGDFAAQIERLYNNRYELARMSENCAARQQELSWDRKAETMAAEYEAIVKAAKNNKTTP